MPRKTGLGKGLSALIPDTVVEWKDERATNASQVRAGLAQVPVNAITPNPRQPRSVMDEAALRELADSIREHGLIQPLIVTQTANSYQLIAGERRWRAAQSVGLASVPVTLRDVPDAQLLELALVENVQRQELSALEEAQAFQRLQDEFHLTQEEIARRVGRERSTIANTMRLLRLPRELRELVGQGRLDAGHARALLALERSEDQLALGREAARKGLSVREVERRVALLRAPQRTVAATRKDANTRAAEDRLRAALGTRVEIARRGRGGQLRLLFSGESELNRLFELLLRAGRGR